MPESLTLRTLQLPPAGNDASATTGLFAGGDASADFQAVLARQLGVSSTEAAVFDRADTAAEGEAVERDTNEPAAAAEDRAALALHAALPQVPATPPGLAVGARDARAAAPGDFSESRAIEEAANPVSAGALTNGAEPRLPRAADIAGQDGRFTWELAGERQNGGMPAAASPQTEISLHGALERKAEFVPLPPAQAAAAHPLDEPMAFGRRAFANDLGERVLWMASNNRQVAELRVDPPHLGPVEVRLSIDGEQASVTLIAAHAGVREALQSSIPRLQDMIQAIGLELGPVTVGGETHPGHQEQAGGRSQRQGDARQEPEHPLAVSGSHAVPLRHAGIGLVDIYA